MGAFGTGTFGTGVFGTAGAPIAAPNDAFADALPIVFSGTEYTSPALDVTACTVEAGEPLQPTGAPDIANTVWWEFVVPVGGTYYFDTDLSDPGADTVLAVYSGGVSGLPGLTLLGAGDDDGVGGNHWSSCSAFVSAGYHLYVQVGAWAGPDANPPTTSLRLHVVGPDGVDVGGGGSDSNVDVALVTESDETFDVDVYVPGLVPLVTETDVALPVAVRTPAFIDVPLVIEMDETPGLYVGEPVIGFLGKAVEDEQVYDGLTPLKQRLGSILMPVEQELALPVRPRRGSGNQIGVAVEREQARVMPVTPATGTVVRAAQVQTVVWSGPGGIFATPGVLQLDALEHDLLQAPTSLLVSVTGALPSRLLNFSIDGVLVDQQMFPNGFDSAMFSVPVPEAQGRRGEHVMTVTQNGSVSASTIFNLRYGPDLLPTDPGPDTPPVEIPESIHPNGVRRWVLQDLMPGGLGSYVMPLNPSEMDNPAFERVLTSVHTTAVNEGQFHITEGSVRPLEWSFKGYCPTQQMAETLRAYAELKRRFYVHDHRGRVWIIVVTSAEIVPRLQQNNIYGDLTDWVHDYTVNAVIFDQAGVL